MLQFWDVSDSQGYGAPRADRAVVLLPSFGNKDDIRAPPEKWYVFQGYAGFIKFSESGNAGLW